MTSFGKRILPAIEFTVLIALTACASDGPQGAEGRADPALAATVDGEAITVEQLDDWIKEDLFRRETSFGSASKLYETRSEAINRMIDQQLIERAAEERGVDVEAFFEAEVSALGPVTDQEIEDFYNENKDRVQGGGELEEIKPGIRNHLETRRTGDVIASFRKAASVKIELARPRTIVEGTGPSRGPADAPVVIVEFSDYQCPYCLRAEATLNELLERYPTEVRWEYRHFPLPSHPHATAAAEAAVCAEAQGKFWEYHDMIFAQQKNLGGDALDTLAKEAGMNLAQFESCRNAPATRARVAADRKAAELAGARGTPVFFVNGIFLSGARPIEHFVELIQAELVIARP